MKVNLYEMLADDFIHDRHKKIEVTLKKLNDKVLLELLIKIAMEHGAGVATLAYVNEKVYDEVLSRMQRRKDMACKKGSCKKPAKKK